MKGKEKHRFVNILREQYAKAGKVARGEILGQICERLGVSRRHARRLMRPSRVGVSKNVARPGRPSRYGSPEFVQALHKLWKTTRFMCSRHLKSAIPDWLGYVEQEDGVYGAEVRPLLLSVSVATIDRILKPWKGRKGVSLTNGGGFRDQIPLQESIWDLEVPGYLEADTVAHCGGSIQGEYIHTLTMVDIATTWTETRAVFGKGSTKIVYAIEDIEQQLPFPILGYDSDNGTEVLNKHVVSYFRDERIERGRPPVKVTRSREYKKNDNAHVEQRNNSVSRRWLGYARLHHQELTELVNYYMRDIICPLMNHFYPSFKLADKVRIRSRTRRIYLSPVTPYARVMASAHVEDAVKQRLKEVHERLNPLELLRREREVGRRIMKALMLLNRGECAQRLLWVPPLAPCFSDSWRAGALERPLALRKSELCKG